ncbi:unnamed protein product [Gongylonema pulchrum]|uniref:Small ribosomal subunit protein uS5 n=1 Tax=Gongylonema pulchrum TaxID=637853 RepID=A0A183CVD9_9BILA|nr:unnamed protein product [Gongylonema pulchrum]
MERRRAFRGGFGSGYFSSFDSRASSDRPWTPVTKLGRLVKDGKVTSIEQIYQKSIPVLEHQIVDRLLPGLKNQVLRILPVQKETSGGLRTRFRAFVAIGDRNGHVGLGVQCAKRVSTAIRRAVYRAKTSVVPIRRAYWHFKTGVPHTIVARYYEVQVKLYPAPRGTGICGPPVIQKLLGLGGIQDCYTSATNCHMLGPLAKATFLAIKKTYFFEPVKDINCDFPELAVANAKL